MTIRVKEKSKEVVMIRCSSDEERQFVLGIFADMKNDPRMKDKIVVKDRNGNAIIVKPKPQEQPIQKSPMEISEEMEKPKETGQI